MACLFKRGKTYYLSYFEGTKRKKVSLKTSVYNIAMEKKRQLESAQAKGHASPLPSKTPLSDIVGKYVNYIRARKTLKSAQTDTYYLRSAFGTICPELEITSRKPAKGKTGKKKAQGEDTINILYLEDITTGKISEFIARKVRAKGLAPKTANRYREIICRMINWAMNEG